MTRHTRPLQEADHCSPSTQSDSGSDDSTAYETDLTEGEGDAAKHSSDGSQLSQLIAGNEHPPEYYTRQAEQFLESEYTREDYSPGTQALLDYTEKLWFQ